MDDHKFEELVQMRKAWVDSSRANGFNFDDILSGLYNDPSHFLFEIIQNAEDAGAKRVTFNLTTEKLTVCHDGRDFDFKDIEGITGIGISRKKTDLNAIGKFGLGFKSVFAVTESPQIFSGKYSIQIDDFVVPSSLEQTEKHKGTRIVLPFNRKTRSKNEVYSAVAQKLDNLGFQSLLFLRHIEEIQWDTPEKKGRYLKSSKDVLASPWAKRVTLISTERAQEYLVVARPIEIEGKKIKVEIAYLLGADENDTMRIVPVSDSKLVVYFPTEKLTHLKFLIQGPYKTTPNRENIPLDNEQNQHILKETAVLVAESLSIIKALGFFDVNFLAHLPISVEDKGSDVIYSSMYEAVKAKFLSEEALMPTNRASFAKTGDVILARGRELTAFFKQDDIEKLFSKTEWLDTDITYDKTRQLRDYLVKEMGVEEVDFESFARLISVDFLKEKSDEWMIGFYKRLREQPALWRERSGRQKAGILRQKPIIRLQNDEHIAPYDALDQIQVYLPGVAHSCYKTVKRCLMEDEDVRAFLKVLGLKEPDAITEVTDFVLPKYGSAEMPSPDNLTDYYDDLSKMLSVYETLPANQKSGWIDGLKNLAIVLCKSSDSGEFFFKTPAETYFPTRDLLAYFSGMSAVHFVAKDLLVRFAEKKKLLETFLREIGCSDCIRRIEVPSTLTFEKKKQLVGEVKGNETITDYDYHKLEEFLRTVDHEKSIALWRLLLKHLGKLGGSESAHFFHGMIECINYRQTDTKYFDSRIVKRLKGAAWLYGVSREMSTAGGMFFSELSDDYEKSSPNVDALVRLLGFKSDLIDKLPAQYQELLSLVEDLTSSELKEVVESVKGKRAATNNISSESEDAVISSPKVNGINEPLPEVAASVAPEPEDQDEPDKKRPPRPQIEPAASLASSSPQNPTKKKADDPRLVTPTNETPRGAASKGKYSEKTTETTPIEHKDQHAEPKEGTEDAKVGRKTGG
ncbi:MAG: hypothetical protein WCJ71_08950 [Candidatus Omnitrophota bacterium]